MLSDSIKFKSIVFAAQIGNASSKTDVTCDSWSLGRGCSTTKLFTTVELDAIRLGFERVLLDGAQCKTITILAMGQC